MLDLERRYAEELVYELVNKHSGLSVYEIAKKIGWSSGKVHNIVMALEKMGLVRTSLEIERGRAKRKVYPVSWVELLPEDVKS